MAVDKIFYFFVPAYPIYLNKQKFGWDSYPDDPRGYFKDTRVGPDGIPYFTIDRSLERDRSYEHTALPEASFQVIAVGDSFTYGQGVRLNDTYIKKLETFPTVPKIYGINFGVIGQNVREVKETLERRISGYKPKLVIYGFMMNDGMAYNESANRVLNQLDVNLNIDLGPGDVPVAWDFINVRVPVIRSLRTGFWKWGSEYSSIVDFVAALKEKSEISKRTIAVYQDQYDQVRNPFGVKETFELISEMKKISEAHGAKFAVLIFPVIYQVSRDYPFKNIHELLQEKLTNQNIPFIDLYEAFSQHSDEDLWVHPIDQHPNELGHRLAAEELEKWMRKGNLIK